MAAPLGGRGAYIMINYSLSMMGNPTDPTAAKRAYARAQEKDVLDINAFAEHIVSHGCVYSKGDIMGILTMAVSCIRENLLAGNSVKLGDLGKFSVSLKSKGAKTFDEFTTECIKNVRVLFSPGTELTNLRQYAQFERVLTKKAEAEAKKEAYQ